MEGYVGQIGIPAADGQRRFPGFPCRCRRYIYPALTRSLTGGKHLGSAQREVAPTAVCWLEIVEQTAAVSEEGGMHYTGQMEVAFCTDLNWFDWYRLLFYSDWVSWHLAGVCAVYKFPLWYIVCTVLKCAKLPPLYPPLHQLRVTGGSVQLWEKAKGIGRSVNTTCRRCIALSCSIFGATAISWMRNGNMRLLR